MVNGETYKNAVKIYPDSCDPNQEIVQALRTGYQVGATEEKKKNIKKLRTILKDFNGKRCDGFDIAYTNYFIDSVCGKMEEPEKIDYIDDGVGSLDELREQLNLDYTQMKSVQDIYNLFAIQVLSKKNHKK